MNLVMALFYRETLRHLPEKFRQERIQATVTNRVAEISKQIIDAATNNQTETSFTLFCFEPDYKSDTYYEWNRYLFQKDGERYRFSNTWKELHTPTEKIVPSPPGHPSIGYELYSRDIETYNGEVEIHNRLEDNPLIYLSHFFKQLDEQFPDLTVSISNDIPSDGLFNTTCCPLYTVSW